MIVLVAAMVVSHQLTPMVTIAALAGLALVASLAACTNPYDPGQRALGGAAIGAGSGAARYLSAVLVYVDATLDEREQQVIRLRFGLDDGQPRTLDEIGQVYGVTRERIRQIESKTMSKLRHPSRSQVLRDYLD